MVRAIFLGGLILATLGAAVLGSKTDEELRAEISTVGPVCEDMCKAVRSFPQCECPGFGSIPADDMPGDNRSCVERFCQKGMGCPNNHVIQCIKAKTPASGTFLQTETKGLRRQLMRLQRSIRRYSATYASKHGTKPVGTLHKSPHLHLRGEQ